MCTHLRPSRPSRWLLVLIVAVFAAGQTGWGAPHGVVDTAFDTDGKQTVDFGGADQAHAVVVQPDGKVVVVGSDTLNFAVARVNPDGSLDTTFSADGRVEVDWPPSPSYEFAQAVALQTDGKIVVTGYTGPAVGGAGPNDFAIARINADGTLDATFSGDGLQTADFLGDDRAMAVAIQPDGENRRCRLYYG